MDKKNVIAVVVALALGAVGTWVGIDFKAAICGAPAPMAVEQAK